MRPPTTFAPPAPKPATVSAAPAELPTKPVSAPAAAAPVPTLLSTVPATAAIAGAARPPARAHLAIAMQWLARPRRASRPCCCSAAPLRCRLRCDLGAHSGVRSHSAPPSEAGVFPARPKHDER